MGQRLGLSALVVVAVAAAALALRPTHAPAFETGAVHVAAADEVRSPTTVATALPSPSARTSTARTTVAPAPAPGTQILGETVTRSDQLIFDGQSFNFAVEKVGGLTYPLQLLKLLGSRIAASRVVGIRGTTYAERAPTAAQRVDALLRPDRRTTILDAAGQSDLLAGLSAPQILAAAEAYAADRRAAGATFIVEFTVTPSAWYSGAQEAQRRAYNNLLRANAHHTFDAVVDLASLPEFATALNVLYLSDGMHPTELGDAVIARAAATAVGRLLATAP